MKVYKTQEEAEYTFSLFVKQVYANALVNMLWVVVGIIGIILSTKWIKRGVKEEEEEIVVFSSVVWIASLIAILFPLGDLIQALINPEYQAIKLIISSFK